MEKKLKESDEVKKLIAANIYFNLYMDSLEEVVKDDGEIYLREYGDKYVKITIIKKEFKCWVDFDFWDEFSQLFSLQNDDVNSIISKWVEDTYRLIGINSRRTRRRGWL